MRLPLLSLFLTLVGLIHHSTYAQTLEHKEFNFPVKIEQLLPGAVHYSHVLITPDELLKKYPQLYEFDSLGLLQEKDIKLLLNKVAYVVNKPAGFFDQKALEEEEFIKHLLSGQKVKQLSAGVYRISVPDGLTYKLKTSYDSDDITTLPHSRAVRSVTTMRRVEVMTLGASCVYRELTDFSAVAVGGVSVSCYIPVRESYTLLITLQMVGIKKSAVSPELKKDAVLEFAAQKNLINNWKPKP